MVVLAALGYRPGKPQQGDFTLEVLDTGQGLAAVIRTQKHLLVYDTGPAYSPRFNAGSGLVAPYLRQRNLGTPDRVIISHGDDDHAGGAAALQTLFPEADFIAGESLEHIPVRAGQCRKGQAWHWDAVRFSILHPGEGNASGNNASCVLKVSTGDYNVLLPGDIELPAELSLVREYRDSLRADILIAPHHGSRTSSTPPFVRSVKPLYVVFTTGYLNRFGHPHPQVIARYQRFGASNLLTVDHGSIRFRISADTGVSAPEFRRQARPRFWSQNDP